MTSNKDINHEEDSDNCFWTWKDTLQRLQYIDKIIDQIVHNAILLDTIFFTAFGVLLTQGIKIDNEFKIRCTCSLVSVGGLFINLFLAKSLARQEYIRKWYIKIIPECLPLLPPNDTSKEEYHEEVSKYKLNCLKYIPEIKEYNSKKESWIIKFGKTKPGYCVTWVYILILVALVFLYLTLASWIL